MTRDIDDLLELIENNREKKSHITKWKAERHYNDVSPFLFKCQAYPILHLIPI